MRGPGDLEDLLRMAPAPPAAPASVRPSSPSANRSPPVTVRSSADRVDLSDQNLDEILSEISLDDLEVTSQAGSTGNPRRAAMLERIRARKAPASGAQLTLDL